VRLGVYINNIFSTTARTAFVLIFFDAVNGNSIWQKCTIICHSAKNLWPKIWGKISAEMLVEQNSIFCTIYFMLAAIARSVNWLEKFTLGVYFYSCSLG
jgi:hypothetical protein